MPFKAAALPAFSRECKAKIASFAARGSGERVDHGRMVARRLTREPTHALKNR